MRRAATIACLTLTLALPVGVAVTSAVPPTVAAADNNADAPGAAGGGSAFDTYVRNPYKPGPQFCLLGFFCDLDPTSTAAVSYGYRLYRFASGFLGILFILLFIYGGVRMLISGGDEKAYDEGRKILIAAVVGFLILILSYAAVTTFIAFAK